MTFIPQRLRSCASLATQQLYPNAGTVLDLAPLVHTKPGAAKRFVRSGRNLVEEGSTTPVKLVGNNTTILPNSPIPIEVQDRIVEKLLRTGKTYVRFHHLEAYLKYLTIGTNTGSVVGTRTYNPDRWAEVHSLLYKFKMAGIRYSFGAASNNLALNTFGRDRYDSVKNTSGTIALTVNGAGTITAAAPGTAGTLYPDPPSVIVSDIVDGNGYGAEIESIIDAAGTVTGYTVINGGIGYNAAATATNYGGTGQCKLRLRLDRRVRQHLGDLVCLDFLEVVSPYTGVAYKNEPALWMVEIMNEAHLLNIATLVAGQGGVVPPEMYPMWVNYLAARYGTIANLNTIWGTSYLGFWSTGPRPRTPGQEPDGTKAQNCRYFESKRWFEQMDIAFYSEIITRIRATGYTGEITARDMTADPSHMGTYAALGVNNATIQTFHPYTGLTDSIDPGSSYLGAGVRGNVPSGFAYNSNTVFATLGHLLDDRPWMFTESGFPMPGVYRGEFGLVYGGWSATHGGIGMVYHADYLNAFDFGPQNFTPLNRALRPHGYEHDPLTSASTWFGTRMLLRGDIDEIPVAITYEVNYRAFGNYSNPADMSTGGTTPYYNYRQRTLAADLEPFVMASRILYKWDATDDVAKATAYVNSSSTGAAQRSLTSLTTTSPRLLADNTAARNWVVTKNNRSVNNYSDKSAGAIGLTPRTSGAGSQQSMVGFDRVAGLFLVDSLRSQAIVASPKFAQGSASVVRLGNVFADNALRDKSASQIGYAFDKNVDGAQFWQNLSIDYIEDGTLFGITSYEKAPISDAERIIIVAASNYYNSGYSATGYRKQITGLTLNGGTGYPDMVEWTLRNTGGGAATVQVFSVGGVPSSYKIVPGQQGGFSAAPDTPPAMVNNSQGTGLTFTNYILTDEPEVNETVVVTGYDSEETKGWPILQKRFVVAGTIRGINQAAPWKLYELDFTGRRLGQMKNSVKPSRKGLKVRIDSSRTIQPSVFFELAKD